MKQEEWLTRYITCAFAGVTLGDGIDLYAAESLDDYGNPSEDQLSLAAEKNDWRLVPPNDLFPRFGALTFLDAAGFRFYAPAVMIAILSNPDRHDECLSSWFLLTLAVDETGSIKDVSFNSLFTLHQRAALVRFLKYIIHHWAYGTGDAGLAGQRLEEIQSRT